MPTPRLTEEDFKRNNWQKLTIDQIKPDDQLYKTLDTENNDWWVGDAEGNLVPASVVNNWLNSYERQLPYQNQVENNEITDVRRAEDIRRNDRFNRDLANVAGSHLMLGLMGSGVALPMMAASGFVPTLMAGANAAAQTGAGLLGATAGAELGNKWYNYVSGGKWDSFGDMMEKNIGGYKELWEYGNPFGLLGGKFAHSKFNDVAQWASDMLRSGNVYSNPMFAGRTNVRPSNNSLNDRFTHGTSDYFSNESTTGTIEPNAGPLESLPLTQNEYELLQLLGHPEEPLGIGDYQRNYIYEAILRNASSRAGNGGGSFIEDLAYDGYPQNTPWDFQRRFNDNIDALNRSIDPQAPSITAGEPHPGRLIRDPFTGEIVPFTEGPSRTTSSTTSRTNSNTPSGTSTNSGTTSGSSKPSSSPGNNREIARQVSQEQATSRSQNQDRFNKLYEDALEIEDVDARRQAIFNLGKDYPEMDYTGTKKYKPDLMTVGETPGDDFYPGEVFERGKKSSKKALLQIAKKRKEAVKKAMEGGLSREEAEAQVRRGYYNIYRRNPENIPIDFTEEGALSREAFDPTTNQFDTYEDYLAAVNDPQSHPTLSSMLMTNSNIGGLTGIDLARVITDAPHGSKINVGSLSRDSFYALLDGLLRRVPEVNTRGIKIDVDPYSKGFNGLERTDAYDRPLHSDEDMNLLIDQVNARYGSSIPYVQGGRRPSFSTTKYKNGGKLFSSL